MKVSHLKQVIEDMPNDAILFVGIIDKDEADEYVVSNLNNEKDFKFTDEQWESIVESIDRDQGVWDEMLGAFRHYVEMKFKEQKGNDDNSK